MDLAETVDFRLLADNLPTLCWGARGDGYIVWYNRRWHEYCGTTHEQMEGWGWTRVHDPVALPAVMERWIACIAAGAPFEMTFPLRRADGRFRPFLTRIQPVLSPEGAVLHWFGVNTDISAQISAEEHCRHFVELNNDTIWTAGPDGQLEGVGGRWSEWTPQTSPDGSWGDVVHPDDLDPTLRAWQTALEMGEPFDIKHRLRARDDTMRWMHSRATPSKDSGGRVVRWIGSTRDIDELKTVQAALEAGEARFRVITNSIDQMIWSTRADGWHDYYNQRWYDYTGVPAGSTDGEAWAGMFHPEDHDRAWAVWRRSLATGEPYHIEYRLRHRSGDYRWVLGRAQAVRDANGAIQRWYGTCTDIEEIVRAREVLARGQEALREQVLARKAERDRLWDTSPDLMMVTGVNARLREVNRAWTRILGYETADLVGQKLERFIHPEDVPATMDTLLRVRDSELPPFESRFRHRDGTNRCIQWTAAASGALVLGTGRDVTEEKAAAASARQSQKMEAVGQLTGGIAHDFNNMLTIVIGSLDLLRRRLPQAESRLLRYVDAAAEGARRAATLTQRLLAFSRQQPLQPESLDVNRLVAGMADLLRHALGSAVQLRTIPHDGLWRTHADPNQLENVILNLAVNARDAMPEGGHLTIETDNIDLDPRTLTAEPGLPAGQFVLLAISDSGTGMPKEVAARAFDPFFTTKEPGRGTGLGLSQVYGFVRQSGGQVRLYSEPGRGTQVKIYLPRDLSGAPPAEESAGQTPDSAHHPKPRSQETILVVEDEAAVRRYSAEALTDLGYRVLEADGAHAALALLHAHPEIALLFTDVVMPDMNGRRLADEVRRHRPDLRILFTTGYTRNAVVHNGVLDPGVALIGKPFTVEALAAKVRDALAKDR